MHGSVQAAGGNAAGGTMIQVSKRLSMYSTYDMYCTCMYLGQCPLSLTVGVRSFYSCNKVTELFQALGHISTTAVLECIGVPALTRLGQARSTP